MSTIERDHLLNDSWEEVSYRDQCILDINMDSEDCQNTNILHVDTLLRTEPAIESGNVSPSPAAMRLLIDAQRESSSVSSRSFTTISRNSDQSSRASLSPKMGLSPKTGHSPNNERSCEGSLLESPPLLPADFNNDWVWDWSSRPEIIPPSDWGRKQRHPVLGGGTVVAEKLSPSSSHHGGEGGNGRLLRSVLFSLEHLPLLLFTHACTFILGAATIIVYMKKYCN